jgi:hypothetical protein
MNKAMTGMDRVIPSLAFGRVLSIFLLSKNEQKNPNVNFMKKINFSNYNLLRPVLVLRNKIYGHNFKSLIIFVA